MTVLQMADMYQAIANDGLRIPPRIVSAEIAPDGTRTATPRPEGVRVVSPQTARTVRDMLRAVTQNERGQRGTGVEAALDGYQISAETGTAQKVNPGCGCYSNSNYWITFAGILPADAPRSWSGSCLMTRPSAAPRRCSTRSPPTWRGRYQIPLSPGPSPLATLTVP